MLQLTSTKELRLLKLSKYTIILIIFISNCRKSAAEAKILEKFQQTPMGKRFEKTKTRENLSDFDRFKVMLLKRKVSSYSLTLFSEKKSYY